MKNKLRIDCRDGGCTISKYADEDAARRVLIKVGECMRKKTPIDLGDTILNPLHVIRAYVIE